MDKILESYVTSAEYALKRTAPFRHGPTAKRVFYPGCSLASGSPELVVEILTLLRNRFPDIGVWHDCCGMPLAKFVSDTAARKDSDRLAREITASGVTEIITACGNCYERLYKLCPSSCRVTSLYDYLAQFNLSVPDKAATFVVHHPCPARTTRAFRDSFWKLAKKISLNTVDTPESPHRLACCLINTPPAIKRQNKVIEEGLPAVTYCAHCTKTFGRRFPTVNILELLFGRTGQMPYQGFFARFVAYAKLRKLLSRAQVRPVPPVR